MKYLLLFLLAVASGFTPFVAQAEINLRDLVKSSPTLNDLLDYQLVELDLADWNRAAAGDDQLELRLRHHDQDLHFSLKRWDMRAADFQAVGRQRRRSAQWLGRVRNGSRASFTINPGFVLGSWQMAGETYQLEPLWRLRAGAKRDQYVLYKATDVAKSAEERCLSIDLGHPNDDKEGADAGAEQGKMDGLCLTVEVALASDFELFQQFGNAQAVEDFMLGVLTNVQTDYDDTFDDELVFSVVATYIATSEATDPWDNTTLAADNDDPNAGILPDFAEWGQANNFGVDYDVASLWTGRDLDGSTVGVAYVGGLCSNFGGKHNVLQNFSGNANSLRVLWSHELGHNFNANHDGGGGFIMSPSVNNTTTWSNNSINVINNFYQGLNCLDQCPPRDPPVAMISAPYQNVYQGSVVPFFDVTTDVVNSLSWSFPGGQPSSSTDPFPVVRYPNPGTYQATLSVTNNAGTGSQSVTINVTDDQQVREVITYENFEEDFGSLTIQNPDGEDTWTLNEAEGPLGAVSAVINNYDNNFQGQADRLQFPVLDFSNRSEALLELEYAYRRYAFNGTISGDELNIRVSTDGVNYTTIFNGAENGNQNFATGPDQRPRFIPASGEDWCFTSPGCISVDLTAYGGEPTVYLEIENLSGFGNLMWIDNVSLTALPVFALPVEWLSFEARTLGKAAAFLDWTVHQDEANEGFSLERSQDNGGSWQSITWLDALPGTENIGYNYTDYTARPGNHYLYRLRQRDRDGRESLSVIRDVVFGELAAVALFPNPAGDRAELRTPYDEGQFELRDVSGRLLSGGNLLGGAATLDLSNLPGGVYFVRVLPVTGDGEVFRLVRR